jgi:hypothetical protein
MSNIYYLCRQLAKSVSRMFGQCKYTGQARVIFKERYNQHLSENFIQENYAEAILQQSSIVQKKITNHILLCSMARDMQSKYLEKHVSHITNFKGAHTRVQ